MNPQGYPGVRHLLHTGPLKDCGGDILGVSSRRQVPHAEERVLFVSLSIVPSQGDAHTLSCYELKWTRSHEAPGVPLTDGFCRAALVECPKFSYRQSIYVVIKEAKCLMRLTTLGCVLSTSRSLSLVFSDIFFVDSIISSF